MGVSRVRPGPFQNTYSGGFLAGIFERGVNNWAQSPETLAGIFERGVNNWAQSPETPAGGELQRNQNHAWEDPCK